VAGETWDAYRRVDRAGEHLADLETRANSYAAREREVTFVKVEGHTVGIVGERNLPPPELSVIAGEVVYNLRTALDYLVFQLAFADSGEVKKGTQFPIEDTPEGFRGRTRSYLKGVSKEHIAAIESLQPYNGHEWLRFLRNVSNADKHKGLQLLGFIAKGPQLNRRDLESDAEVVEGETFKVPGDMGVYCKLTFAVGLDGQPVPQVLHDLQARVRGVLDSFELSKIHVPQVVQGLSLTSAFL
jgi:hypothetical protein